MVWVFTCVNTLADSHVKETSKRPGSTAEKVEKLKTTKYKQLQKDYFMVTIAMIQEKYG